jgi:hypothetical protein
VPAVALDIAALPGVRMPLSACEDK